MSKNKATNKKQTGKTDQSKPKKKAKLSSPKVVVKVKSSYNNTIVSIASLSGDVVGVSSAGTIGFSGSKKSTAYAATKAGQQIAEKAVKLGAKECTVIVKGAGMGRQAAVKGIRSAGLKITSISDFTPIPHGGCKPRKMPKK